MKSVYIIMTQNPKESLISYVEALLNECASRILIVNEDSGSEGKSVYDALAAYPGCTVLSWEGASGDEAYAKAAAWCEAHLLPLGYSDIVRVDYANEMQRQAVLAGAVVEAERAEYERKELMALAGIKGVCDTVLDKLGLYSEVLKVWQPMRSQRAAAMA
ncbi:MAG: hypothetical protein Q4A32_08335 [Lachnospiraceae bacterium]|nr:hypothetical protein [Lachnospiraceae bacterium]